MNIKKIVLSIVMFSGFAGLNFIGQNELVASTEVEEANNVIIQSGGSCKGKAGKKAGTCDNEGKTCVAIKSGGNNICKNKETNIPAADGAPGKCVDTDVKNKCAISGNKTYTCYENTGGNLEVCYGGASESNTDNATCTGAVGDITGNSKNSPCAPGYICVDPDTTDANGIPYPAANKVSGLCTACGTQSNGLCQWNKTSTGYYCSVSTCTGGGSSNPQGGSSNPLENCCDIYQCMMQTDAGLEVASSGYSGDCYLTSTTD